jgi:multicomponent K+:H+ antiporter subunit D
MLTHLPVLPVLVPFLVGLLLLVIRGRDMRVTRVIAVAAVLLQVVLAIALLGAVSDGDILVYRLGDWPAPWGIVLVADRLAAWMVLITNLLALFALLHATNGTDARGAHFHTLFQMQLFGLAGAFLTGDLFNLFVFFEILLLASYGLLLHGGGPDRVRAGLHYVVLNLLGSTVFLFAAGILYGSLGTLNMADLAVRIAEAPDDTLGLVRAGGLLLLAVFALKAALLPLYLWLPAAYTHTSAPVAALFAIMTKVGAYAILRAQTLLFPTGDGPAAGLFEPWLLPLALASLVVGIVGALAADALRRQVAYLVVASIGTLLIAFALGSDGIAAGLYYLPHSTFAAAAMFLLADAIARRRSTAADRLIGDADLPRVALWGGLFFAGAVLIAGLPPLSGFVGKFLILQAATDQAAAPWVLTVVLVTALLGVVALARSGSRIFFNTLTDRPAPAESAATLDLVAIGGLLGLTVLLTVGSGPAFEFADATASQLTEPARYIGAVLGHAAEAP